MKIKKETLFLMLILVMGILVRVYELGKIPGGINQDEAFAGYEAFSILNFGTDSWGYKNPVYFISWGSGMNVLPSYLMIPFIWLFGNTVWAIRMPQLLLSVCSMFVFYKLIKKLTGQKTGFFALFLVAVCPWHIMLSRWGLESNMAPLLLLCGVYFFVCAMENNKYLLLSGIFWGLSLYSYATYWLFVPFTLLVSTIYALYYRKITIKYLFLFILELFVIALPLLIFVLVNMGVISEIKTDIISIPRLLYMRNSEMGISNIFDAETYKRLFEILVCQSDNLPWNSAGKFGIYYILTVPLAIVGLFSVFKRKYSAQNFIGIGFIAGIVICLIIWGANVNKINFIHFYILSFCAFGFERLDRKTGIIFVSGYVILFMCFSAYYFTDYKDEIGYYFDNGIEYAVKNAEESDKQVIVDEEIYYSKILFLSGMDTEEYIKTVKFKNYPAAYLTAESFGKYSFENINESAGKDAVYITKADKENLLKIMGYEIKKYNNIIFAYKNGTF